MSRRARRRKSRDNAAKRTVWFLGIFGILAAAVSAVVLAVLFVATTWLSDLPDYSNLDAYAETGYSTIYAADRQTVLGKVVLENRIRVDDEDISPYVLEGTVATEDERYYSHKGVDMQGIFRALVVNLTGGNEGASTITQQLVRNTILLDEMNSITIERKVREMYLATKVEEQYSKEQILNLYLNIINYGDGCYGIEAAAQDYFHKHASKLTLSEAAMLVGIPQSPTANNPRTHYDAALERSHVVLNRMLSNGYITQQEHDDAMNAAPKIKKKVTVDDSVANIAPYFVDYVKSLMSSDKFNISELSQGGLSIFTTLDVNCQKAANEAVQSGLDDLESGLDSSLTSIDPDNGNIVAMVGGKDYDEDEFNLATQMSRQAGSSFKTFTLLAAMEAGIDPDNTYIDSSSPAYITDNWEVNNSEGEGDGYMSLADATTYSVNTVYARVAHTIGAPAIVKMAHKCGITSDLEEVESICLGTQGVNTLEMASAYATIANGGIYYAPTAILEITNYNGETVYERGTPAGERVISEGIACKVIDILKTVVDYGTGTSAQLWCGQESAGKTGTSEQGRDLWFCGFTPQFSTAVWTGYRQEKATYLYGGSASAPIWRKYMDDVLEDREYESFPTSDEEVEYTYDWEFEEG